MNQNNMEKANLFQEVMEEILFSKEYIDFEKVISLKIITKLKAIIKRFLPSFILNLIANSEKNNKFLLFLII